jgi:hypothetical protein
MYFFAATWSFVGIIWLSTLGSKIARSRKIDRPEGRWLMAAVLDVAAILAADWFSGYFVIVIVGQLAAGCLAFSLGFAIYSLFPSLKAPTGKLLDSILKLVDSPFFGP